MFEQLNEYAFKNIKFNTFLSMEHKNQILSAVNIAARILFSFYNVVTQAIM